MATAKFIIEKLDEGFVLTKDSKTKAMPNYEALRASINQRVETILLELQDGNKRGTKSFELVIVLEALAEAKQQG